jgi:hypothetical protein
LIEATALRWLAIVVGLIVATMVAPPIGLVGVLTLIVYWICKAVQRVRPKQNGGNDAASYWTPDRISQTFYNT